MLVKMLGCGDAYDPEKINSSLLIKEEGYTLLVDCGPTVPQAIFREGIHAEDMDAIYISHCHPDHCLGLTTLLNFLLSKGRSKPLTLICQEKQQVVLQRLVEFAHWPDPELRYGLNWQFSEQLERLGPWTAKTAPTTHSVSNRSLFLSNGGKSVLYSGDGLLSTEGEQLAAEADLVFLECEYMTAANGHGSWNDIAPLEKKPGSEWVLYHIDPASRADIGEAIAIAIGVSLSEDGRSFEV